jgi:hypothetical protein
MRREIAPFIINMENNGHLSNTGDFRTNDGDVEALVTHHVAEARKAWKLADGDVMDVAIYAHGGLVSERAAAETAAKWIPALYENHIFPIFLMWETDLLSTLANRFKDVLAAERPTAGGWDRVGRWWNERLEKLLAVPGSTVWGEMKQNGEAISADAQSGGRKLYAACQKSPFLKDPKKVRLHLIGHSAGAIAHSHIVDVLGKAGWDFETVSFMAPAVRVDVFQRCVIPAIANGTVKRYHQYHLGDEIENKDPTCRAIGLYGRSLLYLVSQSFEKGQVTPILGMQKYYEPIFSGASHMSASVSPGPDSMSTTHGGFDDDDRTMQSVIASIKAGAVGAKKSATGRRRAAPRALGALAGRGAGRGAGKPRR